MSSEFIKTICFLFNELFVVKVFGDKNLGNGEKKRHVGAGFDGIPFVCQGSCFCKAWIQDNQLAAPLHGGH